LSYWIKTIESYNLICFSRLYYR